MGRDKFEPEEAEPEEDFGEDWEDEDPDLE